MGQRRRQTLQGIFRVTPMRYTRSVWYGEAWKDRVMEIEPESQDFKIISPATIT